MRSLYSRHPSYLTCNASAVPTIPATLYVSSAGAALYVWTHTLYVSTHTAACGHAGMRACGHAEAHAEAHAVRIAAVLGHAEAHAVRIAAVLGHAEAHAVRIAQMWHATICVSHATMYYYMSRTICVYVCVFLTAIYYYVCVGTPLYVCPMLQCTTTCLVLYMCTYVFLTTIYYICVYMCSWLYMCSCLVLYMCIYVFLTTIYYYVCVLFFLYFF
jgi:hypothetical protein